MTRIEEALRRIVEDLEHSAHAFALVGDFAVRHVPSHGSRGMWTSSSVCNRTDAGILLGDLATRRYTTVATIENPQPAAWRRRGWRHRLGQATN